MLGTLAYWWAGYASDPERMGICFVEDETDFLESVASYERTPPVTADDPMRRVEFELDVPFALTGDDILLMSAYVEGREVNHRFFDGAPRLDGHVTVRLPAQTETGAEVYWLKVDLIRPEARMTCGWSMEERFALPAVPHPVRWRLELLAEPIDTGDGGARLTRLTPLD